MRRFGKPTIRGSSPLWLERVPTRTSSLLGVVALAAAYLASALLATRDGWGGLAIAAVILLTAAIAIVLLTTAPTLALVVAAVAVSVDAARASGADAWTGALAVVLGAGLLAAAHIRTSVERRDEELVVAANTVADLNRRTRLARTLARTSDRSWLAVELARGDRHSYPLTLLLIRPDAEPVPPELLEEVSRVVVSTLRDSDAPMAEEDGHVAVALPYTDALGGRVVAERIRLAVAAAGEATISVGVAEYPIDADDPRTLVRAAGRAVARARGTGGNRSVCATLPGHVPAAWSLAARATAPHSA